MKSPRRLNNFDIRFLDDSTLLFRLWLNRRCFEAISSPRRRRQLARAAQLM